MKSIDLTKIAVGASDAMLQLFARSHLSVNPLVGRGAFLLLADIDVC